FSQATSEANAFRWEYAAPEASYAYSSSFNLTDIILSGQNIDYTVYIQGFSGGSGIKRCTTLATGAGSTLERLLIFDDYRSVKANGDPTLFIVDNLITSIESGFTESDIITGTR